MICLFQISGLLFLDSLELDNVRESFFITIKCLFIVEVEVCAVLVWAPMTGWEMNETTVTGEHGLDGTVDGFAVCG